MNHKPLWTAAKTGLQDGGGTAHDFHFSNPKLWGEKNSKIIYKRVKEEGKDSINMS